MAEVFQINEEDELVHCGQKAVWHDHDCEYDECAVVSCVVCDLYSADCEL